MAPQNLVGNADALAADEDARPGHQANAFVLRFPTGRALWLVALDPAVPALTPEDHVLGTLAGRHLLPFFLLLFIGGLGGSDDDFIDEPVLLGGLRGQEVVPLRVLRDLLHLLACVPRQDLVQLLPGPQYLLGMDLDVGRLPLHAAPWLVDEDVGVRQRVTLAVRSSRQQHGRHGVGHADADRRDRRPDVLHGVVDGKPRGDVAAWAVDVQGDLLLGVFRLEKEQLRHDQVGDLVIDGSPDEYDAVLEQPRVDVEGALTAPCVLDHHGHQVAGRTLAAAHVVHSLILDRGAPSSRWIRDVVDAPSQLHESIQHAEPAQ